MVGQYTTITVSSNIKTNLLKFKDKHGKQSWNSYFSSLLSLNEKYLVLEQDLIQINDLLKEKEEKIIELYEQIKDLLLSKF